jgi:predicted lactoylglutathione lyase
MATKMFVNLPVENLDRSVTFFTKLGDAFNPQFASGGRKYAEAKDHGFMYQWGFEDPDGHIWEHFWMDPAHVH